MGVEFMVVSAPRSGSAWAANWLTTARALCVHDPLWYRHFSEWDEIACDRKLGVACTGIALFPAFLEGHPARKVIVHRDLGAVNGSLEEAGLPHLPAAWGYALDHIRGMHIEYEELFDARQASRVYAYLTGEPFDAPRHAELCRLNVQLNLRKVHPDRKAARRLLSEMAAIAGSLA